SLPPPLAGEGRGGGRPAARSSSACSGSQWLAVACLASDAPIPTFPRTRGKEQTPAAAIAKAASLPPPLAGEGRGGGRPAARPTPDFRSPAPWRGASTARAASPAARPDRP